MNENFARDSFVYLLGAGAERVGEAVDLGIGMAATTPTVLEPVSLPAIMPAR